MVDSGWSNASCIWVAFESVNMDMLKIEQVIVGDEVGAVPVEMKTEPVVTPLSYQRDSLQCIQCLITFCSSKAKERHMKKSHREEYKLQLMETNTLFSCYTCEKSFTSSEALSEHQIIHFTEDKPFRCSYCCKPFFYFSDMNKHRRRECRKRRSLCTDCGVLFPSIAQLRTHRLAAHPEGSIMANDDNYECLKCGRGFEAEGDLQLHQEKFADQTNCDAKPPGKKRGRKPKCAAANDGKRMKEKDSDSPTEGCSSAQLMIPCPEGECDLIFHSVAALRAHKRVEHGPPPRNAPSSEYSCPICGQSFARESSLRAHQISHTKEEEEDEEEEEEAR